MSVHLARPPDEELRRHLETQSALDFSYPEVGASRDPARLLSRGIRVRYRVHHHRVGLGQGVACFQRACRALDRWEQFRIGWLEFCWPDVPAEPGRCVGVGVAAARLWSFHVSRVVYAEEETSGPVHSHVHAYGTLPDHALRGEERFAVEYHPGNDTVWYDLLAFSRPARPALGLAGPWLRRFQARFAAASGQAMQRAAAEEAEID